jgi:hypothetical protein
MPARTLGIPHEAYMTRTFTQKPPRCRIAILFTSVAEAQQLAAARDDKVAAAV